MQDVFCGKDQGRGKAGEWNQRAGYGEIKRRGYEEAFWEKVIESGGRTIVVIDTRGKIRLSNRKAREVTGYPTREVLDKSWVKTLVSPEHRSRIQGIFDSLLKGGIRFPICRVSRPFETRQGDSGLPGAGSAKRKNRCPSPQPKSHGLRKKIVGKINI